MKRPNPAFRFIFLSVLVVVGLSGLIFKLWYVQIARGDYYKGKIQSGSRVTVRIPAVRGEIMDRNGIPLVQNRASFDVDFYLPDMVRAYKDGHGGSTPSVTFRGTVHNMPKDMKEADVAKIVSTEIIPRLEDLGVAKDYNAQRLQVHYRNDSEVPYNYMQDLDFQTMAVLSERNLGLPGVNITKKPVRQYVYGAMAAQILGYVGMPNDLDKLSDIKKFDFYDPDMEGKAQIELFMNDYLKGTAGTRVLQRNVKGVIEGEVSVKEPIQGANVYLTIDAHIQYIAEKAIRAVGRGAVIVMNPNNGDILAMVSIPSYDPNKFIPSIAAKDWLALNNDETNPMLNRAISAYAPGSTYKTMVSLAGLHAGIGDRTFTCTGGVTYGDKYMKCWVTDRHLPPHGTLHLSDALKYSCNAFFYQYGNAAGIDQIDYMGNLLGLGQKTGIQLSGEAPGLLPSPKWLAQANPQEHWSAGLTANTAIGQGDVLATPLQMVTIASTLANGGTCYYPRLIDRVVEQDGTVHMPDPVKIRTNLITDAGLTAAQIEQVRKGMDKVVNESGGTAGKARIKGVEVAGKTGTAQFWRNGIKDNHTWFICFAPYDAPKYAVVVLVQGAKSGGGVAAPVAAKILEDIFAMDKDKAATPQLAALEPAKGNFNFVDSIDFGRDIPAATTVGADEETSDTGPSGQKNQESKPAAPNVRDDADAGGKVSNRTSSQHKSTGLEKFFNFFRGGDKKQKPAAPPSGHR